jgi:hypothetical protein
VHMTCVGSGPSDLEVLIAQLRRTAYELREAAMRLEQIVQMAPLPEGRVRSAQQWWPELRSQLLTTADETDQWAHAFAGHLDDQRKASAL